MQILLVEDEQGIAEALKQGLEEEGHSVIRAADGLEGLGIARDADLDAIILDLMLPKMDGLTVARLLRDEQNATPILMLTAKDSRREIVEGLDAGGDDYLTKPFSLDELLARLRAITRRGRSGGAEPSLRAGDLALDPASREVHRGERELSLTRTEFRLLELLLRRKNRVVARESIIAAVWGYGSDVEENTLDVLVSQLRRKVDGPSEARLIQTERGVGYRVREPEA
ncbi:MAG: response regulator transcription factor [Bryobacterales bacterium]|nr:response regulator transcription factor [Bryobacterales bacterium]